MAQVNNTTTNPGQNGDTITTVDTTNFSAFPSTGKIPTGTIYASVDTSTVPTPCVKANPLYVRVTDATNVMPTMDAAARRGYVTVTNGTQNLPTMDAVGRAGYVFVTDGTNTQPTMDAVGRAGFQKITDGTNTMPTMDAVGRRGFVTVTDGTNSMPTGDAIARSVFVEIGDGTNVLKSGSVTNVAAGVGTNSLLTVKPGEWSVTNTSTAGAQATVSKAAGGASNKYVITSITVSLAAGAAAQTPLTASVIQDALGTPATLWAATLGAPANSAFAVSAACHIVQTVANKTLDIQFSGTGTANTIQSVTMSGYLTS
jgi:hypothetical protein